MRAVRGVGGGRVLGVYGSARAGGSGPALGGGTGGCGRVGAGGVRLVEVRRGRGRGRRIGGWCVGGVVWRGGWMGR